jgi:NAD(P)-dependent dehydrogenase (short-subunit alcohol dehydrogenase family)
MQLQDKVIIITGSTQGIGKAIAKKCLDQGAKLFIHGKDSEQIQSQGLDYGKDVKGVACDLLTPNAHLQIYEQAIKAFGHVDGLVNNAGIYPRSDIHTTDEQLFDRVMAINAKIPLLLTQCVAKGLIEKKRSGSIVNIGSINAHCGQPDLLAYSMSKGALMTMTRNLADSLSHHMIRVNQLNVGWTSTDNEVKLKQKEGLGDDWQTRIPATYAPRGTILTPEEIAEHAVFWLSDKSIPCNGAVYELEQYPVIGRNRICDLNL